MEDYTTLSLVCLYLDDESIARLSRCSEELKKSASTLRSDHHFFLRTQSMMHCSLEQNPTLDWRTIYYDVRTTIAAADVRGPISLNICEDALLLYLHHPWSLPTMDKELLNCALRQGYLRTIKLFLSMPYLSETVTEAFQVACHFEQLELVRLLLTDERVDIRSDEWRALLYPCKHGFVDIVQLCLEATAEKKLDLNLGLCVETAIRHSQIEVLRVLLQFFDPGTDNSRALRVACWLGITSAVRLLLEDRRVDPSADNNWCIRCVHSKGHTEILQLLLADHRIDQQTKNEYRSNKTSVLLLVAGCASALALLYCATHRSSE